MRNQSLKPTIIIIFLALAGIGIWVLLNSRQDSSNQSQPPSDPDPQTAAERALVTFRLIVTSENYQALGFLTLEEVKSAQLGQPLAVSRVPLDRLQSYSADQPVDGLLVDVNRVIYPIMVDGQVRSSITVEGIDKQWRAMEFGNPKLIAALEQFHQDKTDSIVQIPAFSLYFIARRSDNVLFLTPVIDDDRFGFKAGETLTASSAFEIVLPFAKSYNGLPD